jgi:TPR repeat protein
MESGSKELAAYFDARKRAQYVEAVRHLRAAAELKFPPALFELGWAAEFGFNVPQDSVLALECYRSAAAGMFAPAMAHLAELLRDARLPDESRRWAEAAMASGDLYAKVAIVVLPASAGDLRPA